MASMFNVNSIYFTLFYRGFLSYLDFSSTLVVLLELFGIDSFFLILFDFFLSYLKLSFFERKPLFAPALCHYTVIINFHFGSEYILDQSLKDSKDAATTNFQF